MIALRPSGHPSNPPQQENETPQPISTTTLPHPPPPPGFTDPASLPAIPTPLAPAARDLVPLTVPLDPPIAAELFHELITHQTIALSLIASPYCMAIGVVYRGPALPRVPGQPIVEEEFAWPEDPTWQWPADEFEEATKGIAPSPLPGVLRIEFNEYPYLHLPWHWEDAHRAIGRTFRHWFAAKAWRALQTFCLEVHVWIGVNRPWKVVVRRDGPTTLELSGPR